MMWQAIGILLLGANPTVVVADGFDPGMIASPSDQMGGVPYSAQGAEYTGDFGGYDDCGCGPCGWFGRPCFFDSYWDYTGGRSPTDYSCSYGYGPDWCYTWQTRVEWLMWFSRGRNAPALVSTSDLGTARADAGVLGIATTDTLYGGADEPIGEAMRNGARITVGRMLGDNITGITGRFWGVENGAETKAGDSSDNPIIARPFFNVTTGEEDAFLVAFPGVTAPGSIHLQSRNNLFGADAWLSRNVIHHPCVTLDLLGGYQFTRIDDSLVISSVSTSIDPLAALAIGSTIAVSDSFRTQNQFHGVSMGFLADFRKDVLSFEVLGKIAFGNMRQAVVIGGETTITPTVGAPATSGSGLLARGTNSGSYERDQFAVAPELNMNVLWHFTPQWRAVVGYSIANWSNVVLAGNQIDPAVNTTQTPGPIVGPAFPRFNFQRTDFVVQGINLGLDYRW